MTIERDEAVPGEALGVAIQWPMIAFTGWWEAVFDAWQPTHCPRHERACPDLAVPEPIEREGEHALFA